MFDDIIVPKSYLKGLLKRKHEKFFETKHIFQTKDFDNVLDLYRVHRQRLQRQDRSPEIGTCAPTWENVNVNAEIEFHDLITSPKGDYYFASFKFSFVKGKLDKKELLSLELHMTSEEKEATAKMWDTEQEIFDFYRESSVKYRLFSFLEKVFSKATNWARKKHQLPLSLRKEAYEKSGRLKLDPKALDLYMDV